MSFVFSLWIINEFLNNICMIAFILYYKEMCCIYGNVCLDCRMVLFSTIGRNQTSTGKLKCPLSQNWYGLPEPDRDSPPPLPPSVLLIKKWTTITQVTTLQLARDTSLVSSISCRKRSKRDLDDGFERVLIKQNFYGEERHRELDDSFQLFIV